MAWFQKKSQNNIETGVKVTPFTSNVVRPKPTFENTFRLCTFAMSLNMILPNSKNEKKRFTILAIFGFTWIPVASSLLYDMYLSLVTHDIDGVSRQLTIIIPMVIIFLKTSLATLKRKKLEVFLSQISVDLQNFEKLSDRYQAIVKEGMAESKKAELMWCMMASIVNAFFPFMAMVLMINANLRNDETTRYMLHDLRIPGLQHIQYESPYFEIIFLYMTYICLFIYVNFAGFDGCFCVVVNQASLKIRIFAMRIKIALENARNVTEAKEVVMNAVDDHCKIISYMNDLQDVYGSWLGCIFVTTIVQICLTLYQVTQSFDFKYTTFFVGAIMHIFIPCHFCSNMTFTSQRLSTDLYLTDWNRINDKWVTDAIRLMIFRSQTPFYLTGAGMVIFDMNLFVSMLQSSYSAYTLLTSNK